MIEQPKLKRGGSGVEETKEGGFFSSPEFASQMASQVQDIFKRNEANKMSQVALATAPFSNMSAELLQQSRAGLGEAFDPVGATLKSKAIRDLRLRERREASQKGLVQDREMALDDLKARRMEAQIQELQDRADKRKG